MIFDLWETLVDYPAAAAAELERKWAGRIGADADDFRRRWREERNRRDVGSLAASFRAVGVDDTLVDEFFAMRVAFTRDVLVPRPGAVETLRELREREVRLGMISVCSEDVPLVWDDTAFAGLFESTLFSATCGLRKPQPEIYLRCTGELGVEPRESVFVGDGANDELAGAERVGMRGILIHRPGEDPFWPEVQTWAGPRVTSIPEVLALV